MLKIRNEIRPSGIPDGGYGLFTLDHLYEGQIVEEIDNDFYKTFSIEEVQRMWEIQREFFKKYSFIQKGYHYLSLDNGRFMNHSETPNLSYHNKMWVANRSIPPGTELTTDYREFCENGVDW